MRRHLQLLACLFSGLLLVATTALTQGAELPISLSGGSKSAQPNVIKKGTPEKATESAASNKKEDIASPIIGTWFVKEAAAGNEPAKMRVLKFAPDGTVHYVRHDGVKVFQEQRTQYTFADGKVVYDKKSGWVPDEITMFGDNILRLRTPSKGGQGAAYTRLQIPSAVPSVVGLWEAKIDDHRTVVDFKADGSFQRIFFFANGDQKFYDGTYDITDATLVLHEQPMDQDGTIVWLSSDRFYYRLNRESSGGIIFERKSSR